jgi:hypothetical protein
VHLLDNFVTSNFTVPASCICVAAARICVCIACQLYLCCHSTYLYLYCLPAVSVLPKHVFVFVLPASCICVAKARICICIACRLYCITAARLSQTMQVSAMRIFILKYIKFQLTGQKTKRRDLPVR